MKHNFSSLIKHKKGLRGLPVDLLPLVLDPIKKTTIIKVSSNILDFLLDFYAPRVGVDVALLFSLEGSVPSGFSNKYINVFSVSYSLIEERFDSLLLCFVDSSLFEKPLFPIKKGASFVVNSSISFEGLVGALDRLGYVETDFVEGVGLFSIRGGVLEIFPFGSIVKFRVSFLDDFAKIFIVDLLSGRHLEGVDSFVLRERVSKQKLSLSFLSSSLPVASYFDCALTPSGCCSYFDLCCDVVDFQRFNKIKSSIPVGWVFSGFGPIGYLVDGSFLCVPSWFIKESSIVSPLAVLDVGSLEFDNIYIHEDFGYCLLVGLEQHLKSEKVCLKFSDGFVRLDIKLLGRLSFFGRRGSVDLSFLKNPARGKEKRALPPFWQTSVLRVCFLLMLRENKLFANPMNIKTL